MNNHMKEEELFSVGEEYQARIYERKGKKILFLALPPRK